MYPLDTPLYIHNVQLKNLRSALLVECCSCPDSWINSSIVDVPLFEKSLK